MSVDDPIKHIVVLMLENRSFDQMLGCMKEIYSDLEGVDVAQDDIHTVRDYPDRSNEIAQLHVHERVSEPDPMHEHVNVLRQLDSDYGYVVDYIQAYPQSISRRRLK